MGLCLCKADEALEAGKFAFLICLFRVFLVYHLLVCDFMIQFLLLVGIEWKVSNFFFVNDV